MREEEKKSLTLFLNECWHELITDSDFPAVCSCGMPISKADHRNRPFTTEADMMALYKRLYEVGKWDAYVVYLYLCLSGEGYEGRCEMVDKFLEGRQ